VTFFISVLVPVMISVAMVVTPSPVFLLFFGTKFLEVSVAVPMALVGPAVVVNDLVVVPDVIVSVIRIVNAVGMMLRASNSGHGRSQGGRQ